MDLARRGILGIPFEFSGIGHRRGELGHTSIINARQIQEGDFGIRLECHKESIWTHLRSLDSAWGAAFTRPSAVDHFDAPSQTRVRTQRKRMATEAE